MACISHSTTFPQQGKNSCQPPTNSRRPALLPLAALLAFVVIAAAGCGPAAMLKAAVPATPAPVPTAAPVIVRPAPARTDGVALPLAVDQQALADLYDAIAPSVVNIQVEQSGDAASGLNPFNLPDLPNMPDMPQLPDIPQMPQGGQGTGWVYDTAGHLVTNNHVVDGAEKVTVTFANGLWADAEVVAADPQSDLAVIKVKAPAGVDLRPLPLATNDDLRVGYTVIAIGTPFGLESTMTTGIVSALGRGYPVGDAAGGNYTLPDVIQTDAAINPGNSGGPLLNLNGEVVGINFAIESPVRASSGIGFAIPVSIVRRVIPALIQDGVYHYPYLGIGGQTVTPQLAEALELKRYLVGAYVWSVSDGGPAAKAGVRGGNRPTGQDDRSPRAGGDIVTAIDGQPVRQFEGPGELSHHPNRTRPESDSHRPAGWQDAGGRGDVGRASPPPSPVRCKARPARLTVSPPSTSPARPSATRSYCGVRSPRRSPPKPKR